MSNMLGDWERLIDKGVLLPILQKLSHLYKIKDITPSPDKVFKAFQLCSLSDLRVVIIGQDPYPQKGIATGIAFGNDISTPEDKLSPSLKVLKEGVIDFEKSHNFIIFDNSLESWCKQGVLMLNSALTVEVNNPGSHSLLWREFIIHLLQRLAATTPGIIYLLLGSQAQGFRLYIKEKFNYIHEFTHPAYNARTKIPYKISPVLEDINEILYSMTGDKIEWFKED